MRLIADSPEGLRRMAELLEIPKDLLEDTRMSDRDFKKRLDWYGLSASMNVIRRFRGTG